MAWPKFGMVCLLMLAFLVAADFRARAQEGSFEVEITVEWVRAVEPEIAGPATRLESYDRLAYGKGRFLRLEGKSRRSVLLRLGNDTQQLVRLFDLPCFDQKLFASGQQYYFGGVFSKVERNSTGGIEAIITYANLSEVEGRFYSRQAKEFAARTEQMRRQNETILGKKAPQASSETSAGQVRATQPAPVPPAATPPADAKSAPEPDGAKPGEKEEEDPNEPPRNRPVLKRRMGEEPVETAASGQDSSPGVRGASQTATDDDVVIYRRRDGSRRPASADSSAETRTSRSEPDASDRPVLRRRPAAPEEKKEIDGMVLVPKGGVTLGSNQPEDTDKPLHRVELRAFLIDKYEVTNEEYKQFCEATGHAVPPYWVAKSIPKGLERHPVVQVSWADAADYARWAGKRLPTEAEWERAAKGPNSYRYAYGNAFDPQKANSTTQKAAAVGSYAANEFGLFDMTGNVSEWTSSLYLPYPYSESDGREDAKTAGARTVRGGHHSSDEPGSRCLIRKKELPDHGSPLLGFRCARDAR